MEKLSTNEKIGVFVALVVIIFFFILGPAIIEPIVSISNQSEVSKKSDIEDKSINTMNVDITDTKIGDGKEARNGDRVVVHYVGKLENGDVFDSSIERGDTFTFTLGIGQVIAGWEQGILGMKVGGERTLTIPPELGYGDQGIGPIPGGATLIFDVSLIGIEG